MHEFESDESLKVWIDGDCYLQFCMTHIYSMIPLHSNPYIFVRVVDRYSTPFPSPFRMIPLREWPKLELLPQYGRLLHLLAGLPKVLPEFLVLPRHLRFHINPLPLDILNFTLSSYYQL